MICAGICFSHGRSMISGSCLTLLAQNQIHDQQKCRREDDALNLRRAIFSPWTKCSLRFKI